MVQSIDCTTPARTAYDIGRRTSGDAAIIRIDALLNATRCPVSAVAAIAARHPGARGVRRGPARASPYADASRFFSASTSKSAGGQDMSRPVSASISSSVTASRLYHFRLHGTMCHGP